MRALVILLLLAGTAGATPVETKCYAGTETEDDGAVKLVIERELDRDHHEIRSHNWRESEPSEELVNTWTVASDGKTFTWKRGTGTLEGPAWKWTSAHLEADLGGEKGITDTTTSATKLTSKTRFDEKGKQVAAITIEATAFDCKELAKRVAALDDTAADAKHVCYAGKDSDDKPVVIDQITEPKRVQVVTTRARVTGRIVMAIEGAKIFVKNPKHRSWTGAGTITGKPGEWTGYEYTVTIGGVDIRAEGTLGGPHFAYKTTGQTGGATQIMSVAADAFDCKDLAAKRAALK
jgi:hypothetical protein